MNGPKTGRLKAVLFDKDGTLIDFNGTWFKLYEALALEFARGDKQEAARLLEIGGYDKATEKATGLISGRPGSTIHSRTTAQMPLSRSRSLSPLCAALQKMAASSRSSPTMFRPPPR